MKMSRVPSGPKNRLPSELGDTVVAVTGDTNAVPARGSRMEPGKLFAGRYTILEQVGRGGMGEVFRARDEHVGDVVALKRLRFLSEDARTLERFRREVRLARRISHRQVARIYDLGQDDDIFFLTMEFIEGSDLEMVRRKLGRLPADEVLRIGIACCEGLDAAHAADVIHQDLKPANIMQDNDGRIVITDFGIAAGVDDAKGDQVTAELLGSPAYMAPERVESASPDLRSDIYSMGIILYELLSGTLPFEGETALAMVTARLQVLPKPLPAIEGVPLGLERLIMACLERAPERRPVSARELANALLAIARGEDIGREVLAPRVATAALYAPMLRGEPTLRVRPFQYRGPADTDYLGDGIAEELIDTLSRTRGLRVLAALEPEDANKANDPRVNVIVDGTVHRQGDRFRIIARLTNAETRTQLWSEVFQTQFEDLFVAQEQIARRVAESLRLEVQAAAQHQRMPPEAVQLYLKARDQVKARKILGEGGAVDLLERCMALAPDFSAAIAWHALAVSRAFWDEKEASKLSLDEIRRMIDSALERAPAQAESHLAAAVLASQVGDYRKTAKHLADCLEVAPTCAEAHSYLGELQCATGRQQEGFERLRLARKLNPNQGEANDYPILRRMAYDRDWVGVNQRLNARLAQNPRIDGAILSLFFRFGMWSGRQDWLDKVAEWAPTGGRYAAMFFSIGVRYIQEQIEPREFQAAIFKVAEGSESLRFGTLVLQIASEAHCYMREFELAIEALQAAVASSFNDLNWLEHCPIIDPLRSDARFQEIHELVRQRSMAIWAAG